VQNAGNSIAKIEDPRFAPFWSDNYFPALDGLRALSILLVFFVHIHVARPEIRGWIGVHVFFVLSGFLITTLLLRERELYGRISLRGFYVRRFFRIAPIYYLVLATYFPVVLLMHDQVRWTEFKLALPYLVTFMQEFRPAASGFVFGQAWSLGYEEKFYLLWPLLTVLLFPFKRVSTIIALAIGAVLVIFPLGATINYGSLFLGSLVAIVLARSSTSFARRLLARIPTSLAFLSVLAVYAAFWFHTNLLLWFSASVAMLIGTLVLRTSWLRTLLEHPWIVLAGKRSYAMYLIHVLVIHAVERFATLLHVCKWYTIVPAAYLASFAGATVLFYTVERPCLAYGRTLSKRIRERQHQQPQGTLSRLPPAPASDSLNGAVTPIEREEPGVPNAFANDNEELKSRVGLSWPIASAEEEKR
jgi:peptidoglycan/LPS O-acetylase OafA/YrhL